MVNDEKYITIEHETWKNKYVPMEQKVKDLEAALEKEEAGKTITVVGRTAAFHVNPDYRRNRYSFDSYGPRNKFELLYIDTIDWKESEKKLLEENRLEVSTFLQSLVSENRHIYSKAETEAVIAENNAILRQIENTRATILAVQDQIDRKIAKLPRFVKWLFRIKQ